MTQSASRPACRVSDFGPKASEHKGALHGHGEPNAKETQERRFAHTLAHVLERGHGTKAFAKLVLVAPPKLEELMTLLRPELHP